MTDRHTEKASRQAEQQSVFRQCRGRRIGAGTQFLVQHEETITIALNHLKVVNDGLRIFLFLYLLVNKPFEHALGGEVVLRERYGIEIIDEGGDLLLVFKGLLKKIQR